MKNYLITFTYGENLFGCSTYIVSTLKEAKMQFRKEFAEERLYIVKIEILEILEKIA